MTNTKIELGRDYKICIGLWCDETYVALVDAGCFELFAFRDSIRRNQRFCAWCQL